MTMTSLLNKFIETVIKTEEKGSINVSSFPLSSYINELDIQRSQFNIAAQINYSNSNKMKNQRRKE